MSSTHQDREASSSRASFATSHATGLRERKENLFEIVARSIGFGGEFGDRAFAADASAAEEDEAIAEAGGVGYLVDREEQRASSRGVGPQGGRDLACLAQVESIERLVDE